MGESSNVVALKTKSGKPPSIENGKVQPPKRRKNKDVRSREYLTADDVERLMMAARSIGRHGHRDSTMILVAFRHGLRVSELVALRWEMIDLKQGLLHVSRLKNGVASAHPIRGPELRALRKLGRDYLDTPYLFVTERKGPLTSSAVRKIVSRAGEKVELWDRWKRAGTPNSIGRAFGKPSSSVYHQLAPHEGIETPAERINASVASTG